MANSLSIRMEKSKGDTAVDGLIAGVVAGLAMALLLMATGLLNGTSPLVTLGYFDPGRAGQWLPGIPMHLAVSAIYGALFALLMRLIAPRRPSLTPQAWLAGLAYGLLLYGLAAGVIFKTFETPMRDIAAWQLVTAHLLYGLVLVWWLIRKQ